ncbi:MAG: Holliday junction branch migration protein RuvA [Candidatus Omnitrophota bacterium]|nr:Holliday junction branch migration protein RuvA [Candidatus Omnitrophota bacterium]
MISRIKGHLLKKEENRVLVDVGGIAYEINIPCTVSSCLNENTDGLVELVIYHYLNMDKHRAIPVMIGFIDELEKEFFEKFIGISGIGPKVALKAFDKPIPLIAKAIEDGDISFLRTLEGIGMQKAKQIIASLQGKVGRFALIKSEQAKKESVKKEVIDEAKGILKRLQYSAREIEEMIKNASEVKPQIENVEELLNEIYRQRKIA